MLFLIAVPVAFNLVFFVVAFLIAFTSLFSLLTVLVTRPVAFPACCLFLLFSSCYFYCLLPLHYSLLTFFPR